eukprot:1142571-Pelagomonas_calceolata.AAC.5
MAGHTQTQESVPAQSGPHLYMRLISMSLLTRVTDCKPFNSLQGRGMIAEQSRQALQHPLEGGDLAARTSQSC